MRRIRCSSALLGLAPDEPRHRKVNDPAIHNPPELTFIAFMAPQKKTKNQEKTRKKKDSEGFGRILRDSEEFGRIRKDSEGF